MVCPPAPFTRTAAPCRPARGFTLVELMVVLSVMVIVLAMATPSMAEFNASNQLTAAKSSLASSLALARSEAARRGLPVVLAARAGGASGNEYAGGWEVVGDDNSNGVADASEPRVRGWPALDARVKVSGPASLQFRATGALAGNAAQVFTLCRADGNARGYSITVTPSGVADVATVTNCS